MKRLLYLLTLLLLPCLVWAQFADDPAEPGNKYRLTLTVSPSDAGRAYGAGSYSKGTKVEVYTYANEGYTFSCWKKGDEVVSTSSSFNYVMPNAATTLTAVYTKDGEGGSTFDPTDPSEPNSPGNGGQDVKNTYTLTILKDPEKGGRINQEGSIQMKSGETVYLYATPSTGYEMDGWYINERLMSIQESYSYTMWNKNDTIVARFMYKPSDPTEPGHSENKEFIVISSQSELEAYANVEEFPRSVRIMGTGITSLQSLSRMKKINGDLRIENTSLINLEGLDNLSTITGKLVVSGNRRLVAMDGIYSWDNIYYVLIEDNPELTDFCAMTAYAQNSNPAGSIHGNAYNPTFEQIADGFCSKNEDVFKVTETLLIREPGMIHVKARFTNEPYHYASFSDYVSFASESEALALKSHLLSNLSCDFYFDAPKKEGKYTLKIHNTLGDAKGHVLNQNGNSYTGEDADNYSEDFNFGGEELYIVAQAPLTGGALGEASYTDLVFNDYVESVPTSNISLVSPSGKAIAITSIEYIDSISPARHRVNYGVLDEDGNYSFSVSTGLSSKNGGGMTYPYQSTIEMPSANFVPASVEPVNANWVAGKRQSIKYVVNNVGTKPANGKIVDVIYLSSTETWNSEAIELYRDTISVNVEAQGSYTQTIPVTVPTVVDGKYYLILKTNVTHNVKELSFADNNLSAEGLNVSVEVLTNENNKFTLRRGDSKIFRIQTESDKNVEIIDKYGLANMYLGYYQLPNTEETPNQGSITILGADASVKYYVLVSNNGKNQTKFQQCELSIRNFELEVGNVGRNTIVKHGTAWVPVEVIGCTDIPTFYLMDSKGTKTECKKVVTKTETSFFAQFDTESLAVGQYSLYVESNGMTGLKQNAITVSNETAQTSVISKLVLPETSRIGSTITAYIDYYNSGNVDLPAPLFILSGTEGSTYELPTGGTFTSEAHIIGVNENGVVSALMPGESNRISVNITIPNERISSADYKLKTITEGCDGIDEPFYLQWLNIDPNIVIGDYTQEEWNAYCEKLRQKVGTTWSDFIRALSNICSKYYTSEIFNYDANLLYSILVSDSEDVPIISNMRDPNRRAYELKPSIEPGTIFIWRNNQWLPLVEPEYDIEYEVDNSGAEKMRYIFKEWRRTDNCNTLNASKVYFISHGMNNYHTEPWISEMGSALANIGDGIVLCVDWGYLSSAGWFIPQVSGWYIDQVVERTHDALNIAFNNNKLTNVNLGRFHLIGHSHGAHLCGRLSKRYGIKAKRITALDASEELSHMKGSRTEWCAQYIDYYKSSVTCGTEYLVGDDNFILASGDEKFTNTGIKIWEDISRHGYACSWFTETILLRDILDVGYSWEAKRKDYKSILGHQGWDGVINGPKYTIEGLTNYFKEQSPWNYTSPWYDLNGSRTSEWLFKDCFSGIINYIADDIDNEKPIQCGTSQKISCYVKNKIDNFSVPKIERDNKLYANVTNNIYVSSYGENNYTLKSDKNNLYSISILNPVYYLTSNSVNVIKSGGLFAESQCISFNINISSDLWDKIAGAERNENTIERYLWLVTGLPQWDANAFSTSPTSLNFWKGEMNPKDNIKIQKVTLKNPKLACNAGIDRVIKLLKGQATTNVSVSGTVERDNGKKLSYSWEKGNSVFSTATEGTVALGVGRHPLTFRITAEGDGNARSLRAPTSSENEAEDDVVITVEPYTPGDDDDESTSTASSWDPNEKVGIKGAGSKACVKPGEMMEYSIYFENDAEKAQLAAQTVTVIDTLDVAFDLSTFEFTGSDVSNMVVDIPVGMVETTVFTDMRPNNDLILKTDMKLDIDSRVLTVVYSSLDTLTNEPTQDVFAGFLPPNDSTHIGEGHFSYRVKLKDNVADGYTINNQAHIFFDFNDEIATNITSHTIDNSAPASWVIGLPQTTDQDSILVEWTGVDQGAGIKYYDVYCAKNGGAFNLWKEKTSESSAYVHGIAGDKYAFFSVATDSLGYVENLKTEAEASITFVTPDGIENVVTDSENGVEVYPRIVTEQFTVTIRNANSCNVISTEVFDISGRSYMTEKNAVKSASYTQSYNCQSLVPGVYLVNVNADNKRLATVKIIKRQY